MAERGSYMIHNPWSLTAADADGHRAEASLLDQVAAGLATTYAQRSRLTEAEVTAGMRKEVWLSADEALAVGLVDAVD